MDPEEELQALEDLIDQLLKGIQDTLLSGQKLSDEFQGVLAKELAQTVDRMTVLRSEIEQRRAQERTPEALAQLGAAPPPDAQLLWVLSGQQEQPFINYLRQFPSDATQAILRSPQELSRTIEYLSRVMPPGQTLPVADGIQHAPLQSSNVWGAKYDPRTGKMMVRFQGGSIYEYDGVPKNIFRAFMAGNAVAKTSGKNAFGSWWRGKSPSIGSAMHQYIREGGFPYRKIK